MGRAAIYCRVSKRDMNPENQRLELEQYARARGFEFDVFEEHESSRKTRPIHEQVLNDVRSRKYDTLIVWRLDRWARSVSELCLEVDEFIQKGTNFVSLRDNLDFSTATGKLQFHILAAFAEFEREIIRERTLAGLDRARAEGTKLGRPRKVV